MGTFHNSLKIVNETQIISENKQIIFNSKIIYSDSHYALRKIILNTEHFDKMEYFFEDVENGETIDQFTYHYIYLKSDPLPIFKQMEDVYYNEFKSYNEKEIETQKKKKDLAIGDKLNLNYNLVGINRKDIYLKEYFKQNDFLIIYTWGTWCGPCIANTKNVEKFYEECKKTKFITLMCEKGKADFSKKKSYTDRKNISYPVYSNEDFVKDNNFSVYPILAVIDKYGTVIDMVIGYADDGHFIYEKILEKYGK